MNRPWNRAPPRPSLPLPPGVRQTPDVPGQQDRRASAHAHYAAQRQGGRAARKPQEEEHRDLHTEVANAQAEVGERERKEDKNT